MLCLFLIHPMKLQSGQQCLVRVSLIMLSMVPTMRSFVKLASQIIINVILTLFGCFLKCFPASGSKQSEPSGSRQESDKDSYLNHLPFVWLTVQHKQNRPFIQHCITTHKSRKYSLHLRLLLQKTRI